MRILITGANGHLGIRLINNLSVDHEVVAVVRSSAALAQVKDLHCRSLVVDYADVDGLAAAARDCDVAVHLVGIIKKTRFNSYEQAHEIPCAALVSAAEKAGLKQIIALSILGSDPDANNECLASRGRSEVILTAGSIPARIIRVPMVLGENDFASKALFGKARKIPGFGFRTASLEQPIYAGDIIEAISAIIERTPANELIMLAGPEVLSRAELIKRAGRVIGKNPFTISLPVVLGRLFARALEMFMSSPPVTEDMIDLLDHDDEIDSETTARQIGIKLTSLDEMLSRVAVITNDQIIN